VFVVETYDFISDSDLEILKRELLMEKPKILNVTGPIFVEGAEPGKVLRVDILDLEITGEEGRIVAIPGKGCFKERIDEITTKTVKIDKHFVYFSENLKIPVNPMLGKIGVAPEEGEIPSGNPGPHGGNMDNKQIRRGSSVYLPIFVEGAFLGVGDAHALMADGESIVSGVETEAEATLRCEVVDGLNLTHPVVVDGNEVMTVADGKTIEEASKKALFNMAKLISDRMDLDFIDSAMLISIIGDVRICQMVNPLVSVRVVIPKFILPLL
jgi:amidase